MALHSLKVAYFDVRKKPLLVDFVMGDADDAQYNAVHQLLSDERPVKYLMCFYWQCHHNPSGFAKTNNPVEQFNKVIKRDFTLRARLKIGTLVQKLSSSCLVRSVSMPDVVKTQDQIKLLRRVKLLKKANKLEARVVDQVVYDYMIGEHVTVKSLFVRSVKTGVDCQRGGPPRSAPLTAEEKERLKRTMSWNQARMEWEGQPDGDWFVNVDTNYCQSRYFFKFAMCTHLLFALAWLDRRMPWEPPAPRKFFNRSVSRASSGRPRQAGHALSMV
jgi:hypothetical protein